jgi:hypothetical protein
MMIYLEKIAPPPPLPLTDDELKLRAINEDRWVKNLIDGLAGTLRGKMILK